MYEAFASAGWFFSSRPDKITQDLLRFIEGIAADTTISPGALGLPGTQAEIPGRIQQAYVVRG
jgi:hypothetical protein